MTTPIPPRPRLGPSTMPRVIQAAFVGILGICWYAAGKADLLNPVMFPKPDDVVAKLLVLFQSHQIFGDVATTLRTTIIAYSIAVACGIVVGYGLSTSSFLTRVYEPILAGIYAIPIYIFFPLFILFFGIGPGSKIMLGALYGFLPIALNTITGFASVDSRLLIAAHSMGASHIQIVRRILLPGALAIILGGLRIGFISCFASVVAGEMIASENGLGHAIAMNAELLNMASMFAHILLVIAFAFFANFVLSLFERRRGDA